MAKKWLLLIGILIIAAGSFVWFWHAGGRAATTFRTVPVKRGDLQAIITATGTIEPEEVVDVGAQVVGMVKEFGRDLDDSTKHVDFGSRVEESTILAQLDPSIYQAQVKQARANLDLARSNLAQFEANSRKAESDWTRAQNLQTRSAISQADFDLARANFETTRANVEVGKAAIGQAQAILDTADINLGYTTIRSPVKGVIVDRRVNVGQTMVPSLAAPSLFLIAKDLKRLQVWASVNEADIGRIAVGQAVRFNVDAHPKVVFNGEVAQIRLNATMTQNVVTYTVVVATDNSSGRLLPYLTASLRFEIARRQSVLLVPTAALRWRPQPQQIAPDIREAYLKEEKRWETEAEQTPTTANAKKEHDRGQVWVLDTGFVRPVEVGIGLSDGIQTEIVSGELVEAQSVVVGESQAADGEGTTNPFAPRLFSGGQK